MFADSFFFFFRFSFHIRTYIHFANVDYLLFEKKKSIQLVLFQCNTKIWTDFKWFLRWKYAHLELWLIIILYSKSINVRVFSILPEYRNACAIDNFWIEIIKVKKWIYVLDFHEKFTINGRNITWCIFCFDIEQ